MGTEVEAKLIADGPEPLAELSARSWLGPVTLGPARTFDEVDRYLDTDDGRLAAEQWACRLRNRDGALKVSLKGPAQDSAFAWIHRRPELEGPATERLDPAAWPASRARTLLESLAAGRPLRERLRLVQQRTEREVLMEGRRVGTLSLDTVEPEAEGRRRGVLHVVELELRDDAGHDEHLLAQIRDALLAVPHLTPDPHTKLEHALAMID